MAEVMSSAATLERGTIEVMGESIGSSSPPIMERIGKLSESNRGFDVEFWQRQVTNAIFAAAWEMVVEANRLKGKSHSELAFQRTVEIIQSAGR
jgi:hypothetical protein